MFHPASSVSFLFFPTLIPVIGDVYVGSLTRQARRACALELALPRPTRRSSYHYPRMCRLYSLSKGARDLEKGFVMLPEKVWSGSLWKIAGERKTCVDIVWDKVLADLDCHSRL
jgi:hypothetical protein